MDARGQGREVGDRGVARLLAAIRGRAQNGAHRLSDRRGPGRPASSDTTALSAAEAERTCSLLAASWKVCDKVISKAPAELRKGPRGGGRDRDKIADHIIDAESAYTPKLGLKV